MVEITIEGLDEALSSLTRVVRSQVIRDTFRALGGATETRAKEAIEKSEDADTGAAFAPLAEKTLQRGHRTGVPLLDRGDLLREAGAHTSDARHLEISAGVAYGVYHQDGTEHIPRRKFVPTAHAWYTQEFRSALARRMKTA